MLTRDRPNKGGRQGDFGHVHKTAWVSTVGERFTWTRKPWKLLWWWEAYIRQGFLSSPIAHASPSPTLAPLLPSRIPLPPNLSSVSIPHPQVMPVTSSRGTAHTLKLMPASEGLSRASPPRVTALLLLLVCLHESLKACWALCGREANGASQMQKPALYREKQTRKASRPAGLATL